MGIGAGVLGRRLALGAGLLLLAGAVAGVWRPWVHSSGPCHGDYRTAPTDGAFTNGTPAGTAAYLPPDPSSNDDPSRMRAVLGSAKVFRGGPGLGRLRWAASHRIVSNVIGIAQQADDVTAYVPISLSAVHDGTVVVTAPLVNSDVDDEGGSYGLRMGALRARDGRVVWTCTRDARPGDGSGPEPTPEPPETRRTATAGRFTYTAGVDRPGLTVRDRRTGRTRRTAAFLPAPAGPLVMPGTNTGDGTELAAGDGVLIAETGNLTLAFDLPSGS